MIGAIIAKMKTRSAFEALNQRDFPKFSAAWRDDCVFIYPGDVKMSGKHEGKAAIEKWFKKFLEQFPQIHFSLKNVCVDNILDFVGTNTVAVHWDLKMTNRDGAKIKNSGVTVITIKFGKALYVKDFFFDSNETVKNAWGVE
jgi:ketosteroid isomerase-like protein